MSSKNDVISSPQEPVVRTRIADPATGVHVHFSRTEEVKRSRLKSFGSAIGGWFEVNADTLVFVVPLVLMICLFLFVEMNTAKERDRLSERITRMSLDLAIERSQADRQKEELLALRKELTQLQAELVPVELKKEG